MPLSLKEAEVAAYADPSQENLAVYVKLLEETITGLDGELAELREELDRADRRITELEGEVETLEDEIDALQGVGK